MASSIDKTVNRAGDLRVSAKYEFGIIDDLVAGNKELTNDSRSEAVQAIIIDSSYGISDRFSVLAFITYWFAWGAFYPGADIYSE